MNAKTNAQGRNWCYWGSPSPFGSIYGDGVSRQISVLLSNDEYDIIKKIISKSVNFAEPVLYI